MEENIHYKYKAGHFIRLDGLWYIDMAGHGIYNWIQVHYVPAAYSMYQKCFKPLPEELLIQLVTDKLFGKVDISTWKPSRNDEGY